MTIIKADEKQRDARHSPVSCHECAPKDWRGTPNITGSYELDGMIDRTTNKDMKDRLRMYAAGGFVPNAGAGALDAGYGPRTGYNGYNGYSGDD
jgi:hypothetical protein